MNTEDPKKHIGHNLIEDHFAKDFGGRHVNGNAYCADCLTPVAIDVIQRGKLSKDALERKE